MTTPPKLPQPKTQHQHEKQRSPLEHIPEVDKKAYIKANSIELTDYMDNEGNDVQSIHFDGFININLVINIICILEDGRVLLQTNILITCTEALKYECSLKKEKSEMRLEE